MSDTVARVTESAIRDFGPLTRKGAEVFIKANSKGRAIFVHAGVFLPTEGDRGFDFGATVRVTKTVALKFVRDVLSETLEKRGARIRVSMSERCLFIG